MKFLQRWDEIIPPIWGYIEKIDYYGEGRGLNIPVLSA
jgi:hypothetical protein